MTITKPEIHIIGGGIAGLAAAAYLSPYGYPCIVHEAAQAPGGRCRSFHSEALGMLIDNGNHLLLGCNPHMLQLCQLIGSRGSLTSPKEAEYQFYDRAQGTMLRLAPGTSRWPGWIFNENQRLTATSAGDYRVILSLLLARPAKSAATVLAGAAEPLATVLKLLCTSLFNTPPAFVPARALGQALLTMQLTKGGFTGYAAARSLEESFIAPLLRFITAQGGSVRTNQRLLSLEHNGKYVTQLMFNDDVISVRPQDWVLLATPWAISARLIPGLTPPQHFHPIINGHFAYDYSAQSPYLGLLHSPADWLFFRPGIISTTTSAGEALALQTEAEIAQILWGEIQAALSISAPLPAYHIIKEKRATFRQDLTHQKLRPPITTQFTNLLLCGDYIQSSLPATLENAARAARQAATRTIQQNH